MNNFWEKLSQPFFALAPMEDVTDTVFREIVLSVADPVKLKLLFTEFTSVDGLCHPKGREAVIHRLLVNNSERELLNSGNIKLVVQIWGTDPEKFYSASRYISDHYDFDGIDINMGCPVAKIVKQGGCSALIGQNELVSDIIQATREGSGLPVSVKTRTGIKEHTTEQWVAFLLETGISAIILHARTQRMMSEKPAEWDQVKLAVDIRNQINPAIKLIGNGDVRNISHGLELMSETGADGAMVGRGIFADPWFFSSQVKDRRIDKNLDLLKSHIISFGNTWGNSKNFSLLKRFFKIYISGFDGAAAFRAQLMESLNTSEAVDLIEQFKSIDF
ncbi:MAG: tRNA-dihydrouridine synthase [Lentimicrobium sp.]|nr:tRNA-dihydrouridine synthase [Lentimicrobium sp.]